MVVITKKLTTRTMQACIFAVLALAIGTTVQTARAKKPINTIGTPGIAIKGYDPVAYFKHSEPLKGDPTYTFKHKGVKWQFSSKANMQAFQENPNKYEPEYGGYCAYGVAQGYLVKIEPDAWSIVEGKLYLNYNKKVRALWNKSQKLYIKNANNNFKELIKK